jgi:hypothetical protein
MCCSGCILVASSNDCACLLSSAIIGAVITITAADQQHPTMLHSVKVDMISIASHSISNDCAQAVAAVVVVAAAAAAAAAGASQT